MQQVREYEIQIDFDIAKKCQKLVREIGFLIIFWNTLEALH